MNENDPRTPLLATTVADELRRLIYSGELAPGMRLNEAALANRMGTSRGPIREAIRILAGKGLVTAVAHRGMFVRQMSVRDMLESYDLRAIIFGYAARRATEFLTPERRQGLEELLARMEAIHGQDQHDLYYELNLQFHARILEYSNNRQAAQADEAYANNLHVFRRRLFNYAHQMQRSSQEHRAIVAAMSAGDAARAGALAEQHVLSGKQRLLENLGDFDLRQGS